jgi:hypothetical protein
MINAVKVNAARPYFMPQYFCEKNRAFGGIPRFKNPVKYGGNSRINRKTVHFAGPAAASKPEILHWYQRLKRRLTRL